MSASLTTTPNLIEPLRVPARPGSPRRSAPRPTPARTGPRSGRARWPARPRSAPPCSRSPRATATPARPSRARATSRSSPSWREAASASVWSSSAREVSPRRSVAKPSRASDSASPETQPGAPVDRQRVGRGVGGLLEPALGPPHHGSSGEDHAVADPRAHRLGEGHRLLVEGIRALDVALAQEQVPQARPELDLGELQVETAGGQHGPLGEGNRRVQVTTRLDHPRDVGADVDQRPLRADRLEVLHRRQVVLERRLQVAAETSRQPCRGGRHRSAPPVGALGVQGDDVVEELQGALVLGGPHVGEGEELRTRRPATADRRARRPAAGRPPPRLAPARGRPPRPS